MCKQSVGLRTDLTSTLTSRKTHWMFLRWLDWMSVPYKTKIWCMHQKFFWSFLNFFSRQPILFRQVALADVLIINKLDLIGKEELAQLRDLLRYNIRLFSMSILWILLILVLTVDSVFNQQHCFRACFYLRSICMSGLNESYYSHFSARIFLNSITRKFLIALSVIRSLVRFSLAWRFFLINKRR